MDNLLIYLIQSYNREALDFLFDKYLKISKIWAKELLISNGYSMYELEFLECDLINNLYRSIESYDSSKGIFYSYIKSVVNFTVKNYFRDYLRFNLNACSLESEIEDDIVLLDVLASEDNVSKIVERSYVLEEMETVINKLELFKDEEKDVIKLKMGGYLIDEISKKTGLSIRKVNYIISKFKKM